NGSSTARSRAGLPASSGCAPMARAARRSDRARAARAGRVRRRTGNWSPTSPARTSAIACSCAASMAVEIGSCSRAAKASIRSGENADSPNPQEPLMTDLLTGDLVPIHGGGNALVDRIVPLSRRARFLAEAELLPSLRVSRADLSTIHRIGDGALSP